MTNCYKIFNIALLLCIMGLPVFAQQSIQEDEAVVKKVADFILSEAELGFMDKKGNYYPDFKTIPKDLEVGFASKYGDWHYTNGVINLAMMHLAKHTGEQQYIAFGFDNYKFFQNRFENDRPYHRYPLGQLWTMMELDDFGAISASMLEVMEKVDRPEYKDYIMKGAERMSKGQVRMFDQTLVRTFPQEMTLWRLAVYTGENKYFDDAILQILNFDKYLWNPANGLYFHCYHSDTEENGVAHWGRSNGWLVLAQVHLLERLPDGYPGKEKVRKNLEKQLIGLTRYQDNDGLWKQLLDKNDSYQETSASAMFVQGFAKAINEGWIDKRFASVALRGWDGLKKIMITEDGQLKDICVGT